VLQIYCIYFTASHSIPSVISDEDTSLISQSSLADRIRLFTSYIDEATETDLHNFFNEIIQEIFGRGTAKGWTLDKIKPKVWNNFNTFCKSLFYLIQSNLLNQQ